MLLELLSALGGCFIGAYAGTSVGHALARRRAPKPPGVLAAADITNAVLAGDIRIDDFAEGVVKGRLQGASYDLTLGSTFFRRRYGLSDYDSPLDLTAPDIERLFERVEGPIVLAPGEMVIGHTHERAGTVSPAYNSELATTSSAARFGIDTHAGAGWGDPCFKDRWALEIYNRSPDFVVLEPGMILCQIVFMRLASASSLRYGKEVGQYALEEGEVFDAARLLPKRIKIDRRLPPLSRGVRMVDPIDVPADEPAEGGEA